MDLDGVDGGGLNSASSVLAMLVMQLAKRHNRPKRGGGRPRPQRPQRQKREGGEKLGDRTPTRSFTRPVKVESLQVYEGDGRGHTLARHVNHAPNADVERLEREHSIPAAGSFTSVEIAQRAVDAAIAANEDSIVSWLNDGKARGPFVRDHPMGEKIGSVLTRTAFNKAKARGETPVNVDADTIRIVLRRSGDFSGGFFVLTAYPIPVTPSSAVPPISVEPLRRYEGDGHTLSRHVEIDARELVRRLETNPEISAASRFVDEATAQRTMERAIAAKAGEIHDWLATGSNLPFTGDIALDEPVGVVLTRRAFEEGRMQPSPANRIHFILIRSDDYASGFFIKTAYPVLAW